MGKKISLRNEIVFHSFSQSFEGRVANPKDVIVICQRRPRHLNPYFPALKLPPTSTAKPEIKEEDGGQQNGVEEVIVDGRLFERTYLGIFTTAF